jgi:DNA-binding response OmpR family regulator
MTDAPAPTANPRILVIDDSATVLRVIEAVLVQAGYEAMCLDSGRDVVEVARRMRPSLVLVDFAMPDVSGFAVCRALGRHPDTDGIPIVLMTTRGDPVGDRFVREVGIVDHITKPFAPEVLLALVEHVLDQPASARRRGPPPPPIPAAAVAIPEPPLLEAEPGGTTVVVLQGDLVGIPIAEVMQLLSLQRQTGVLTVRKGAAEIATFFKQGQVRLVTGTNLSPELLLGNILVQERMVSADELEQLLTNRRGTRRLLGGQVVQLGYVTREELHRALRRQSTELMYELLRWREGRFTFERKDQLSSEVVEFEFGVSIDVLLLEGFRRVDEWGLIESVLKSFDVVPAAVPGGVEHLGASGLTSDETAVLATVDGKRTIHEIIRLLGMPAFEVARLLYRLISARLVLLPPVPTLMEEIDTPA